MINRRLLDSKMALEGITQRKLAKIFKRSERTINQKFQGVNSFNLEEIKALKNILKLTNDEVIEIFISPNK